MATNKNTFYQKNTDDAAVKGRMAVSNSTPGGKSAMSGMNRLKPDQDHCQLANKDKGRPSTPPGFGGITYRGDY